MIISLTVKRVIIESIIEEFVISSFYKFKAIINIKLYVISFGVLSIIIKIELFKYVYKRGNIISYFLKFLRLLI